MDPMTLKCPGCGADLKLELAQSPEGEMPSMDEAASMPLDQLRSKLPKKAE